MDEATRLHNEAMSLADDAFVGKYKRTLNGTQIQELYDRSHKLEAKAARMIPIGTEPTRSVLFRSAASLAMCAGDYQASLELIAEGIHEDAPWEIVAELEELRIEVEGYIEILNQPSVPEPVPCVAECVGRE